MAISTLSYMILMVCTFLTWDIVVVGVGGAVRFLCTSTSRLLMQRSVGINEVGEASGVSEEAASGMDGFVMGKLVL